MVVRARCPNPECGKSYTIDDSHVGRSTTCKQCGQRFTLSVSGGDTHPPDRNSDTAAAPAKHRPANLGRFQIRTKLGAGAFGAVYRGYDPTLDREVALKVPHPGSLQTERDRDRFLREPKAAAQLRHPNIVPIYDAGVDGETYYIASAFIEGRTLQEAIDEERIDFEGAVQIIRHLADALDYAHQQGVVHRDVKPANIILDASGEPLLLDFGLARFEERESNLTQDGTILGTPAYMPPEQASAQHELVGPASDQYSLGVVFYELLCGQTPFTGPPTLVISMVINQEPPSPRSINGDILQDLETICLKAMSKGREQRYSSCRDLADDLRRWQEDEPIHARPLTPIERLARWCRRNRLVAALVATAVLLLVLVTVVTSVAYVRTAEAWGREAAERRHAEEQTQIAKTEQKRAMVAQERTQMALKDEAAARRSAQQAAKDAELQRQLAEKALKKETVARQRAERYLYAGRINLAYHNRRADELGSAVSQLADCPPELRHWEWGFLKHHCHVYALHRLDSRPRCLTFSAKGDQLVVGTSSATVEVRNLTTPGNALVLRGHHDEVQSVACSPNDDRIASASDDGTVKVWASATGNELLTLRGHSDKVRSVVFSPDGRRIASGSADGTVRVWDALTGIHIATIPGKAKWSRVVFSSNGREIIFCGSNEKLTVWDVNAGRAVRMLGESAWGDVAIGAAGCLVAYDGESGNDVRVLEFSTGRQVSRHESYTFDLSPRRRQIAIASDFLRICDTTTQQHTPFGQHTGFVYDMEFSPDGRRVASVGEDSLLVVWNLDTPRKVISVRAHDANVTCVAFTPDGRRILTGGVDGKLRLWDAATGAKQSEFQGGHDAAIHRMAFSPNGERLVSRSFREEFVKIWSVASGKETARLRYGKASRLVFSPNSTQLVTGNNDNTVRFWDPSTGKEIRVLEVMSTRVRSVVAFSSDGSRFAANGPDVMQVFDTATGQELLTIKDCEATIVFSPDGRQLATTNMEETIKIWDADTGAEIRTLRGHTSRVSSFCYSRDSRRILSGSDDKTVRLWDAATGTELLVLRDNSSSVMGVAFSPDGKRIASVTSGPENALRIWDAAEYRQ